MTVEKKFNVKFPNVQFYKKKKRKTEKKESNYIIQRNICVSLWYTTFQIKNDSDSQCLEELWQVLKDAWKNFILQHRMTVYLRERTWFHFDLLKFITVCSYLYDIYIYFCICRNISFYYLERIFARYAFPYMSLRLLHKVSRIMSWY